MTEQFVRMTLIGDRLAVKPLNVRSFNRYLEACRVSGCMYDSATKTNQTPVENAPNVIEKLAGADYKIASDEKVVEALRSRADELDASNALAHSLVDEHGLYPFQAEGVSFLFSHDRALLMDDMGLGKTIQALMALPKDAATVVVCPAIVKRNWKAEIKRWRPDFHPTILTGKSSFKWPKPNEVVILNYEILPDHTDILQPYRIHFIVDEAHYVKNSKAQRTKKLRRMIANADATASTVWLLTGTPLLNKPPELWNVLQMANLAHRAYGSWNNFSYLFGGYRGPFGYEWGNPESGAGDNLARVALRRRKKDVLPQLPSKQYRQILVDTTKDTRDKCDYVLAEMKQAPEEDWASIAEMSGAREALACAKIGSLVALVCEYEEQEEPVVVFSAHKAPINALGKREGWEAITGDTEQKCRQQAIEAFQDGQRKGIALTIQAGGIGINLTRASHVIFVDQMWVPATNQQAEDRICRIGQDRGCLYTYLVADHELDRMIAETLRHKKKIVDETIEQIVPKNGVSLDLRRIADLIESVNRKDMETN